MPFRALLIPTWTTKVTIMLTLLNLCGKSAVKPVKDSKRSEVFVEQSMMIIVKLRPMTEYPWHFVTAEISLP